MTNPICQAGKKLFAQNPDDVRQYAAADTAYEEDEYVAQQAEDERADRRKVRLIRFFPLQHALPPLPATLSPLPPTHSVTFPLAFRREMRLFCTL
jgi:hypothetical protein